MQKLSQLIIEPVKRDPLRHLPGYALRRASASMMAKFTKLLAPFRLTPTEASILLFLKANPGASQSDLGRLLGIQRANMAPLTAQLEARSLVRRDKTNGRTQSIWLTPEGTTTTNKVWKLVETFENDALSKIAPEHREAFMSALQSFWDDEPEQA